MYVCKVVGVLSGVVLIFVEFDLSNSILIVKGVNCYLWLVDIDVVVLMFVECVLIVL